MNRRLPWQLAFMMLGLASAADAETATAEPGCRAAYGDIWGEERSGHAIREIDGTGFRSLSDLTAAIGKPAGGVTRWRREPIFLMVISMAAGLRAASRAGMSMMPI